MMPLPFDLSEVMRLSGLSERKVRALVRAGLVGEPVLASPKEAALRLKTQACTRLAGSESKRLRFSFRDLKVLRMAATLLTKGLRFGRATRALTLLKGQAAARDMPLSGTSIVQKEGRMVASDGNSVWDVEAGAGAEGGSANPSDSAGAAPSQISVSLAKRRRRREALRRPKRRGAKVALPLRCQRQGADNYFEQALGQEASSPARAFVLYLRALACDPEHVESLINAGRLSSADDDSERALKFFRLATHIDPAHPIAHFNLAVTLHDLGQMDAAMDAYRQTLLHDPHFADAHYNLGGLLEKRGQTQEAFRHFLAFRRSLEQTPAP